MTIFASRNEIVLIVELRIFGEADWELFYYFQEHHHLLSGGTWLCIKWKIIFIVLRYKFNFAVCICWWTTGVVDRAARHSDDSWAAFVCEVECIGSNTSMYVPTHSTHPSFCYARSTTVRWSEWQDENNIVCLMEKRISRSTFLSLMCSIHSQSIPYYSDVVQE